jgi:hypothetical protein
MHELRSLSCESRTPLVEFLSHSRVMVSRKQAFFFPILLVTSMRTQSSEYIVETLRRLIINSFSLCLYGYLMIRRSVAEVKGIHYCYSPQSRFAGAVSERLVCFNLSLKCQKTAVSAKCLYWITPSLLFTRMDS